MVTFILSHGGDIVIDPNGVNYSGGKKDHLVMNGPFSYNMLVQAVADKLAVGGNQTISRLWYRLPTQYGNFLMFNKVEVASDSDVHAMMKTTNPESGKSLMQLYVETMPVTSRRLGQSRVQCLDTMVVGIPVQQVPSSPYMSQGDCRSYASLLQRSGERSLRSSCNIVRERTSDSTHGDAYGCNKPCDDHEDRDAPVQVGHGNGDAENVENDPNHEQSYSPDSFARRAAEVWKMGDELCVGQKFHNKKQVKLAVKVYSIKIKAEYWVVESYSECWHVACAKAECRWRLRATLSDRQGDKFVVNIYNGPHTCTRTLVSSHRKKVDSDFICDCIMEDIRANPATPVRDIRVNLRGRLNFMPFYAMTWEAKLKAVVRIWGDWEESYSHLPSWMDAMKASNPGSIVELETRDFSLEKKMFCRVFWAFKPCIDSLCYVKPVLAIDAFPQAGKYKHTLMVATAIDGDDKVIPIAYALVESENGDNWSWFVNQLRQYVMHDRNDFCVISNQNRRIVSILKYRPGQDSRFCYHRLCLRDVCNTFKSLCGNVEVENLLERAGRTCQEQKFVKFMGMIKGISRNAEEWMDKNLREKEEWAMCYDGWHRWGQTDQNVAQCVRGLLMSARHLPVTALLQHTFDATAKFYEEQRRHYTAQQPQHKTFTDKCESIINHRLKSARLHKVTPSNDSSFIYEIQSGIKKEGNEGGNRHVVNLEDRCCSCGKFLLNYMT